MNVTEDQIAATGLIHAGAISTNADTTTGIGLHMNKRNDTSGMAVLDLHFLKIGDTL